MKKIIFSLLAVTVVLFILSCSGSGEAVEYSYQYLEKTRQDAYTEVYKYRYKIAEGEWQDIDIYVKSEKMLYVIHMEGYFGHQQNRYVYDSFKKSQNFTSQLTLEPKTVQSVKEAIELALGMYIQNIKSKELINTESGS
jgi:hypothetical protein